MCKYKKLIESKKGITLISLVVTIIVLLILASITLGAIKGNNSIVNKAKDAKKEEEISQWEERIDVSIIETEEKKKNPTLEDVIDGLYEDGVIDDKEEDVDRITGAITTNDPEYVIEGKLDDYLEKTPPDLEGNVIFTYNPEQLTSDNVKVTITLNIEVKFTLQYSKDSIEWKEYTEPVTMEKNGVIYARLINNRGEVGGYATGNVDNIDKLKPKDFEVQVLEVTQNTIKVSGNTVDEEKTEEYACSGIKGYQFSKDNGNTWEPAIPQASGTYTFTELQAYTDYNLKIKAVDNVGNEKDTEVVIQKTSPDKLSEPTMKFKSKTTNSITIDTVVEDEAGRNITYTLYVSENKAGPYEAKANKEAVAGTNVTLTASNLDMYTNYYYYVGVKSGTVTAESSTKNQVRTFCSGRTNSCTPTYCKGGTRTSYQGTCSKCSGAGSITCTGTMKKVYTTGGPGSTCPRCGNPNSYGGYNWSCDTCSASGHYYWCTCGYKNGSTPSHNKKKCTTCGGDGKVTKYRTSNCSHGFGYGSSHYWCQHSNDMGSSATHYYCEHSTAGVEHD